MHNPPTAAELKAVFSAEEAAMRRALGLDAASTPLPPKRPRHRPDVRQQVEVALRVVRKDNEVITFHHTEKTISLTQALCNANKKARKYGLRVLWTESAEIKEYENHVVPR